MATIFVPLAGHLAKAAVGGALHATTNFIHAHEEEQKKKQEEEKKKNAKPNGNTGAHFGAKSSGGKKNTNSTGKTKHSMNHFVNMFENDMYTMETDVDNGVHYLIHPKQPKSHNFGAFDFFSPLNYNNMFHYDFGAPKKRKVGRPKKGRGRPKGKGKKTTKRTTTKKKGTSTKKSIYELVFTSKIHGIAKPVGIYKKRLVSVGSLAYKRWKHTTKYKFECIGTHHLEPTKKTKLFKKIGLKTKGKGKGGRPKKTSGKTSGKTGKTAKFGFGCGSGGCGGYGRFGREMYPSNYHFGNQGFYPTLGSTMGPYPSAFVTPISPVSTVTGTGTKAAFGRARYGCNNRFGRSMNRY